MPFTEAPGAEKKMLGVNLALQNSLRDYDTDFARIDRAATSITPGIRKLIFLMRLSLSVCSLPLLRVSGDGCLPHVRGAAVVPLRELGVCPSVFGGGKDWYLMNTWEGLRGRGWPTTLKAERGEINTPRGSHAPPRAGMKRVFPMITKSHRRCAWVLVKVIWVVLSYSKLVKQTWQIECGRSQRKRMAATAKPSEMPGDDWVSHKAPEHLWLCGSKPRHSGLHFHGD